MCGLVGVFGTLSYKEEKVFKNLLFMDQLRGAHSTGVVHCSSSFSPTIAKAAMPAHYFLEWSPFKSLMSKSDNRLFIGHNRYATKGAVNGVNAHPFQHGDIYGVHNGTLTNQKLLPDSHLFEVDSDNIYYSISQIGIDETVKKLHGAYALVWWDDLNKTLNMIRNSERTLSYAIDKNDTLYWASERLMLETALVRNDIKDYTVVDLPVNTLFSFEFVKGHTVFLSGVGKPHVRELTPYTPPLPPKTTPASGTSSASTSGKVSYINKGKGPVKTANNLEDALPLLKEIGYNRLEEVGFYFDKGYEKSVSCAAISSRDQDASIRVLNVNEEDAEEMDEWDSLGFFVATDLLYIAIQDGKLERLVIDFPKLDVRSWEEYPDFEDEVDDDSTFTGLVLDHKGQEITESLFNRRYQFCDYCDHALLYDDEYKHLTSYNTGICGDCVSDPALRGLIPSFPATKVN